MKILVSACLLGENCKYNGGNNRNERVLKFLEGHEVVPVCPEVRAGLGIPRTPIEICNGQVIARDGRNVDAAIRRAVAEILEELEPLDFDCAVLKARSPTCGVHEVYDGTFTGTKIPGAGVFAQVLKDAGCRVLDETDLEE